MLGSVAQADKLNQAIKLDLSTNQAGIETQKKIDVLSEQTSKMLESYRNALRRTETLRIYNAYIEDLIQSQEAEKLSLQKQVQDITVTQREIVPLILSMLEHLEKFIELDLPFLLDERQQRLAQLQTMISRADISTAEKFRRIIEAYQIENDYGNTIEAYRALLTLDNQESAVDFLRLGRVALFFRRLDGSSVGYWDKNKQAWQQLPADYDMAIRNGLRIARKEAAPDMLVLPVASPVKGSSE